MNFLLITTDQQRWDHLSLAGTPGLRTPNLDRLGREGQWMRRAYCPSPTCTPSRVSMLTGLMPSRHGAWSIGVETEVTAEMSAFEQLRRAGYHTGFAGKAHFVPKAVEERHLLGGDIPEIGEQPGPNPDEPAVLQKLRDHREPYLGFEQPRLSKSHNLKGGARMHFRIWLQDQGLSEVEIDQLFNHPKPDSQTGVSPTPTHLHQTHWIGEETIAFLQQQGPDTPWAYWTSFEDPHIPHVCPEPYYSAVSDDAIQLFEENYPGEFDAKPPFYRNARKAGWTGAYPELNEEHPPGCAFPKTDWDDAKKREALRATIGMIHFIDDEVGRILDTLEAQGQLDDTLIVFTSDHGDYHGHHGFWGKGLPAYEDAQRVPFLVRGPGVVSGNGQPCDALVSLVDIPATFLARAGITPPVGTQGRDLSPVLAGEASAVQDEVFIECRPASHRAYQLTLVTAQYKLVTYADFYDGELYDLAADPNQLRNLWEVPEAGALKAKLLEQMARGRLAHEGSVHPRPRFA